MLTAWDIANIATNYGIVMCGTPTELVEDILQRLSKGDPSIVEFLRSKPQVARALGRQDHLHIFDMSPFDVWRLFEQTPRVQLPDDAVIVTAATPDYWPYLQLLAISLRLSHVVRSVCFDLGLTEYQRHWLQRYGMEVVSVDEFLITNVDHWACWNKPLLVRQAADLASKILWIDADAFVLRSLQPIFELLETQPVFTPDNIARATRPDLWERDLRNLDVLYDHLPVVRRLTGDRYLNNGVFALQCPRDRYIVDAWLEVTRYVAADAKLRTAVRCWDQGTMLWVLERHHLSDTIVQRFDWNDAVAMRAARSLSEIADRAFRGVESPVICHQAGKDKHMLRFPLDQIQDPVESPLSLKVFVLGHTAEQFATIAMKHYMEFVRLDTLDVPEVFRHNGLCEGRAFLSDDIFRQIEESTCDYIGFATASWNTKYAKHCPRIDHVYRLTFAPNVVWGAHPIGPEWIEVLNHEHPGSHWVNGDLEAIAGCSFRQRSLWSNNFICAKPVALAFLHFWRRVFLAFWDRYFPDVGYHGLNFETSRWCPLRKWSYIVERVGMGFFASRPDLEIRQIA